MNNIEEAIRESTIDIIKPLIDNAESKYLYPFLKMAILYNRINIVSYLIKNKGVYIDDEIINYAVSHNRYNILRKLKRIR